MNGYAWELRALVTVLIRGTASDRSLSKVENMKSLLIPVAAIVVIGFGAQAQAAGCLSGAAVGGVAGHVAGHHALLGAAAGCAVGHHMANKQAARTSNTNAPNNNTTTPTQQ